VVAACYLGHLKNFLIYWLISQRLQWLPVRQHIYKLAVQNNPKLPVSLDPWLQPLQRPTVWNSLPFNCRSCKLFSTFARTLKTELFDMPSCRYDSFATHGGAIHAFWLIDLHAFEPAVPRHASAKLFVRSPSLSVSWYTLHVVGERCRQSTSLCSGIVRRGRVGRIKILGQWSDSRRHNRAVMIQFGGDITTQHAADNHFPGKLRTFRWNLYLHR